jgi:hypothetical protein
MRTSCLHYEYDIMITSVVMATSANALIPAATFNAQLFGALILFSASKEDWVAPR